MRTPTPPSSTTITWSTTGAGARVATSCSDREYEAEIQSNKWIRFGNFVSNWISKQTSKGLTFSESLGCAAELCFPFANHSNLVANLHIGENRSDDEILIETLPGPTDVRQRLPEGSRVVRGRRRGRQDEGQPEPVRARLPRHVPLVIRGTRAVIHSFTHSQCSIWGRNIPDDPKTIQLVRIKQTLPVLPACKAYFPGTKS